MTRKCFYMVLFQVMATTTVLFGQKLSLAEVRTDFKIGHEDEDTCKKHLEALEEYADCPVGRGYEAAYQMFMAKHVGNPLKKMSYFRKGKKMLENEISSNPNNTELRYIRLCIQYYIPSFLGYKNNIEEDKDFLVRNLHKLQDERTKQLLYSNLEGAKMYSEKELTLLSR